MRIQVKRAYDPPEPSDGQRVLVDRLWPRGLKKESLRLHEWLKDAAPSDSLRRWFSHDASRWTEFKRRYFAELDAHPEATRRLTEMAADGPITLLYGARDREHNQAVALKCYIDEEGSSSRQRRS
jgi:uncharacterized protein YeaO (DUF488 family)